MKDGTENTVSIADQSGGASVVFGIWFSLEVLMSAKFLGSNRGKQQNPKSQFKLIIDMLISGKYIISVMVCDIHRHHLRQRTVPA